MSLGDARIVLAAAVADIEAHVSVWAFGVDAEELDGGEQFAAYVEIGKLGRVCTVHAVEKSPGLAVHRCLESLNRWLAAKEAHVSPVHAP